MNSKNAFRAFIIFRELVDFCRGPIEDATMPPGIKSLVVAHAPHTVYLSSTIRDTFDTAMILIGLGAFVGLMMFRNWGRCLYVLYVFLTFVTVPTGSDVIVATRWSYPVDLLSYALYGVAITLMFCPPVGLCFHRPPNRK
jgi:hypothetical protein